MKTKKLNLMIWSVLGLTALALLLFASAGEAQAKTRVSATVRTPHGVIHVNNGRPARVRVGRRVPLPQRRVVSVRITRNDKKIAKRLSWYTGVPRRELISMKRMGYSWREIGRWLDLPRGVVRAAKHKGSWKRFLRASERQTCLLDHHGGNYLSECRGNIGHGGNRNVRGNRGNSYDEGYYYDDDGRYGDERRYSLKEKTPR